MNEEGTYTVTIERTVQYKFKIISRSQSDAEDRAIELLNHSQPGKEIDLQIKNVDFEPNF